MVGDAFHTVSSATNQTVRKCLKLGQSIQCHKYYRFRFKKLFLIFEKDISVFQTCFEIMANVETMPKVKR